MNKLALIFTTVLAFTSTHSFAGDAVAGKIKSVTCAACHGVDGNSAAPTFPKLAGQAENYLLKQLKDFKSGARIDPIMVGMVAPLKEVDMADLAAYFSSQKVSKSFGAGDLALGKRIYLGGNKEEGVSACVACHGVTGEGIPTAGFPALSSQHSMYLVKQLKALRQFSINAQTDDTKASRSNDRDGVMVKFTKNLTNKEIDAVVAYISSLN